MTLLDYPQNLMLNQNLADQVAAVRRLPGQLYSLEKDKLKDQVKQWIEADNGTRTLQGNTEETSRTFP